MNQRLMQSMACGLGVAGFLAHPVPAQEAATKPALKAVAPAQTRDTVESIQTDLTNTRNTWMKAYRKASATERRKMAQSYPQPTKHRARMWKVVERAPKDPSAAEALAWIVKNQARGEELERALGMLTENHLQSKAIAGVCMILGRNLGAPALKFLKTTRTEATGETQGIATYANAQILLQRANMARRLATMSGQKREAMSKSLDTFVGPGTSTMLEKLDPKLLERDAEKLLTTVQTEFPNLSFGSRKIAKMAKATLFELRHLSVGKIAPDIQGEDIDGIAFKLSDYRGKVVLLDFWGDW